MTNEMTNLVDQLSIENVCIYERNGFYHAEIMSIPELYCFDIYNSNGNVVINNEVFESVEEAQRKVDELIDSVDVNEYRNLFNSKEEAIEWAQNSENLTEEQREYLLEDLEDLDM